jgi:hypothetical protein
MDSLPVVWILLYTHPFQPGHTYSNKATPSDGATPWSEDIQTITKLKNDILPFVILVLSSSDNACFTLHLLKAKLLIHFKSVQL